MVNTFVVGAGAWGTAIANLLARNGNKVTIWAYEESVVNSINNDRINLQYLPNVTLEENITAVNDFKFIKEADIVFFVTPCQLAENLFSQISALKLIKNNIPLVICSKGIENNSNNLLSDILSKYFINPILVMSGPNFADEVALNKPAITSLAASNIKIAEFVAKTLENSNFKIFINDDIIATQIAGSIKNVIAIIVGIASGLNLSESTKAAILTKGLNEIGSLAVALGGKMVTMVEPCAVGDLVLTSLSLKSRNMSLGYDLGKGNKLAEILSRRKTVAEGVATTKSAYEIAVKHNINLELITLIYNILYNNYPLSESDFYL
jgi:glycerol-3-phosphate dehydrogenase (NAD(P)+)